MLFELQLLPRAACLGSQDQEAARTNAFWVYGPHQAARLGPQDPEAFVPERFLEGTAAAAARPAHGWIPFGDGARGCPGAKFGTEEAVLTLARPPSIINHFKKSAQAKQGFK